MIRFWKIHRMVRKFFEKHYPNLLLLSVIVAAFTGYLHFELKHNSQELNRWRNLLLFFNEIEALILLPIILLVTSLMLVLVFAINLDSIRCYDELTHLQIRKRYADCLFIQLVTRIEQIEKKELSKEIISIESFIRAHEEMRKTIDKFRMDTKNLLALSEVEVLVAPENIFSDDEVLRSPFAHLSPGEDIVRELSAS